MSATHERGGHFELSNALIARSKTSISLSCGMRYYRYMVNIPELLPDDIETLKALLLEQHIRNTQLEAQVLTLQEQLNRALAKRYAASSEKCSPDQLRLFNEAELESTQADEDAQSTLFIEAHPRKKRGRKKLPMALPRVDMIYELLEAERHCDHDGRLLNDIGEVISEELDIILVQIRVLRHIHKKYACPCGKCIKTAPARTTDPQESGLAGAVGPRDGLQIPGCLTVVSGGNHPATHRGGHPQGDAGQLDDQNGHLDPIAHQPAARETVGLRHYPDG